MKSPAPANLSVVVVSYNSREPLLRTLAALGDAGPEVLVVDNASPDGTAEAVRRKAPRAKLVVLPNNCGYSAAVNAGVAAARGERILLLNGDVVLDRDTLLRVAACTDRAAVIGFAQRNESGTPQLTWGRRPGWLSEWRRRRRERRFRAGQGRLPDHALSVDWVSGSCMLFSREAFDHVGPWDERYFLYFEDIDWCLRARAAGLAVRLEPEPVVTHLHGYSTGREPDRSQRHYRESQLLFWYTHKGPAACRLLRWYLFTRYRLWPAGADAGLAELVRRWSPPPRSTPCASST